MRFWLDENVSRAVDQNSLTPWGEQNSLTPERNNAKQQLEVLLAHDQVVLLKTAANLSVSRRQPNDFFAFFILFLSFVSGNIKGLGETKPTVSLGTSH